VLDVSDIGRCSVVHDITLSLTARCQLMQCRVGL
jgi:hypothetical protein